MIFSEYGLRGLDIKLLPTFEGNRIINYILCILGRVYKEWDTLYLRAKFAFWLSGEPSDHQRDLAGSHTASYLVRAELLFSIIIFMATSNAMRRPFIKDFF